MKSALSRVHSIDAFRAVTMFLMIFVNDLDGIPGVPQWLKHADINSDALGLADTIFPAFLFIVGLSIPFAFQSRLHQGDNKIPLRIITRSFALIVIGFYHANMETYDEAATHLPRPVWESLLTFSFFLLFLDYRNIQSKTQRYLLQGAGLLLLIVMSLLYRSSDPNHWVWLHLSWWGILGLIGWSYLVCGLIYYYAEGVLWVQAAAWVFFMFFNIDFHFGWLNFLSGIQKYVWIAGNGAMQAFTMAGVFVSVLYIRLKENREIKMLWPALLMLAVILFNLGFITRYFSGGISKMRDTPAWVLICTGISLVVYCLFIFVVDFKNKYKWFGFIRPAGTSTFTCYLLPFLFYPIYEMANIGYPEYLSQGTGGLIKCIVFSFLMIRLAGLLEKVNVRLKI
jgi:predicted acyltransferase